MVKINVCFIRHFNYTACGGIRFKRFLWLVNGIQYCKKYNENIENTTIIIDKTNWYL